MLNEPNADELNVDVANSGGGGGGVAGLAAPTGAAAGERPADATLVLTAQDRDAIERVRRPQNTLFYFKPQLVFEILIFIQCFCSIFQQLKGLGFPEHLVLQAYFACEKNENLAANFLLSSNMDD